jgi:hypothetical protein
MSYGNPPGVFVPCLMPVVGNTLFLRGHKSHTPSSLCVGCLLFLACVASGVSQALLLFFLSIYFSVRLGGRFPVRCYLCSFRVCYTGSTGKFRRKVHSQNIRKELAGCTPAVLAAPRPSSSVPPCSCKACSRLPTRMNLVLLYYSSEWIFPKCSIKSFSGSTTHRTWAVQSCGERHCRDAVMVP